MDQESRIRRTAIVCSHFMRNAAYYRAGWEDQKPRRSGEFWTTVNGNFFDICVLEWCKLFGDKTGEHFWQKVVTEPTTFWSEMLKKLRVTQEEFDSYITLMRTARDKLIAHLENDATMHVPDLITGLRSVMYLYDNLLTSAETAKFVQELCPSGARYYGTCSYQGLRVYGENERRLPESVGLL